MSDQDLHAASLAALARVHNFILFKISPLTTHTTPQREFESWSTLNTVVYHGTAEDRELIRLHELAYDNDTIDNAGNGGESQLSLRSP